MFRAEIKEFALRLYLLEMSEATPIKSHSHDCPNTSLTRMTAINMPKWTGRLQPYTKNYRQLRNAESRGNGLPGRSSSTPVDYARPNGQP